MLRASDDFTLIRYAAIHTPVTPFLIFFAAMSRRQFTTPPYLRRCRYAAHARYDAAQRAATSYADSCFDFAAIYAAFAIFDITLHYAAARHAAFVCACACRYDIDE